MDELLGTHKSGTELGVSAELSDRPRKILEWQTPAEPFSRLVGILT
jgi:IS30 family transposase